MTREEQINKAAFDYADTLEIGENRFDYEDIEFAFQSGAEWADENPKSPWISVEDDLPCNHEDMIALAGNLSNHTCSVLVRFDHGGINFAYMYCSGCKQKWHWAESGIITHWMPIPKLKEE